MSRHNQIPLRMTVENGRLSPSSAFDQERLDSYSNGSVIQVYFWQGRNAALSRKYWAILSKAVKDCNTPWENAEEANDALKLALGITDVGKTVNDQWFVRPGSIAYGAMDEAKFRDFFEKAMTVLSRITGVDPLTLGAEAADTGYDDRPDHDPETGEIHESNPETEAPSSSPAASVEGDGSSPSPSPNPENDVLIRFAGDVLPKAADSRIEISTLSKIEKTWATELSKLSEAGKEKARAISRSIRSIANDPAKLDGILEFYAEMLECSFEDLNGKGSAAVYPTEAS